MILRDVLEACELAGSGSLIRRQVQVVGEVVLVTGSWSATVQDQNGPVQAHGFWGGAYVRGGGAWKARVAIVNRALPPQ